jgi:hypothetical protein
MEDARFMSLSFKDQIKNIELARDMIYGNANLSSLIFK